MRLKNQTHMLCIAVLVAFGEITRNKPRSFRKYFFGDKL